MHPASRPPTVAISALLRALTKASGSRQSER
jgi:hypothetical protein